MRTAHTLLTTMAVLALAACRPGHATTDTTAAATTAAPISAAMTGVAPGPVTATGQLAELPIC